MQSEVEILSKLQHPNIISLLGYSTNDTARFIVYELMPNVSLESHLHGTETGYIFFVEVVSMKNWNLLFKFLPLRIFSRFGDHMAYEDEDCSWCNEVSVCVWTCNISQSRWLKQLLFLCVFQIRGLEYLHEHSHPAIIHRDLKSSNILLDSNYNAKVNKSMFKVIMLQYHILCFFRLKL